MTLAQRLISRFNFTTQRKGTLLFSERAVRLTEGGTRHFHGQVQGTRFYDVSIDFEPNLVILYCECQYFADSGPCKHLWAAILEADRRGLLKDAAAAPTLTVESDISSRIDDDDDFEDVPSRRKPSPPPTRLPMWQDHLAAIQRALPPDHHDPREIEVVYIVDAVGSRSIGALDVLLSSRTRKKNGEWSVLKDFRITPSTISTLPDPVDQEALASFLGGQEPYNFRYAAGTQRRVLTSPLARKLVPLVAATGRLLLSSGGFNAHTEPVTWDPGEPWKFHLEVAPRRQEPVGHQRLPASLR